MKLIDKYLPKYTYNEIHSIDVNGCLEECYNATIQVDLSKSRIIALLFRIRGLPFSNSKLPDFARDMKFTLLEENRFTEFVYGFWAKSKIEWVENKTAFMENDKGYNQKVVWNFSFEKIDENLTKIITETRIKCLTKKAKFIFSGYWFFIKPFSGIIRIKMLKIIKESVSKRTK